MILEGGGVVNKDAKQVFRDWLIFYFSTKIDWERKDVLSKCLLACVPTIGSFVLSLRKIISLALNHLVTLSAWFCAFVWRTRGSVSAVRGLLSLAQTPSRGTSFLAMSLLRTSKGCRQKQTNSIFKDIIQIEVDPPSLPPYFWQIYFWQSVDHVDLPPLEFLTKIMTF